MSDNILNDCFAKTINYYGIHSKFCLDNPEILEAELKLQERKEDIHRFTQIALANYTNKEDEKLIKQLSKYDNLIYELADNENLLRDLDLL